MVTVETIEAGATKHTYRVRVTEGRSETVHDVTLATGDLSRLGQPGEAGDRFVARCFDFLLAREPKESILRRFDISVISRYFSEFEREIGRPSGTSPRQ